MPVRRGHSHCDLSQAEFSLLDITRRWSKDVLRDKVTPYIYITLGIFPVEGVTVVGHLPVSPALAIT